MATFERPAEVIRVHDGDTVIVELDLGWHVRLKTALRLDGLAAPELRIDRRPNPAGEAARAYAEHLLPPGTAVTVVSRSLSGSFEKYGRALGDLILPDGRSFASAMLDAGHGVAWDGTGHQPSG